MTTKLIIYGIICDNCGERWVDEDRCISALWAKTDILNEVRNSETWHTDRSLDNEKHYCPNCFKINDNDVLIITPKLKKDD